MITMGKLLGMESSVISPKQTKGPFLDKNQFIGVELEYNKVHLPQDVRSMYWEVIEDGSLRDYGKEFRHVRPLSGSRLERSINIFFRKMFLAIYRIDLETSCHIHLDIREFTQKQLAGLILLSSIYEELLYTDNYRFASGFCKKVTNNALYLRSVRKVIRTLYTEANRELIVAVFGRYNIDRYYSHGLSSVLKFGSVEYRTFQAPRAKEELIDNINLVQSFALMAKTLPGNYEDDLDHIINLLPLRDLPPKFMHRINQDFVESVQDRGDYF